MLCTLFHPYAHTVLHYLHMLWVNDAKEMNDELTKLVWWVLAVIATSCSSMMVCWHQKFEPERILEVIN
jgi:hypothetical protein